MHRSHSAELATPSSAALDQAVATKGHGARLARWGLGPAAPLPLAGPGPPLVWLGISSGSAVTVIRRPSTKADSTCYPSHCVMRLLKPSPNASRNTMGGGAALRKGVSKLVAPAILRRDV